MRRLSWMVAAVWVLLAPGTAAGAGWQGLPVPSVADPHQIAAAVGADGTAAIVWQGAGGRVHASVRPPSGTFGAPEPVSPGAASSPAVAVEPDGSVLVAYVDLADAVDVQAKRRPPAGSFPGVEGEPLGPTTVSSKVSVALTSTGRALVAWQTDEQVLLAQRRPGETTFGEVVDIEREAGEHVTDVSPIAVDGDGDRAAVAWTSEQSGTTRARTVTMNGGTIGAAWIAGEATDTAGTLNDYSDPRVEFAGPRQLVAWRDRRQTESATEFVFAGRIGPDTGFDADFTAPPLISSDDADAPLATAGAPDGTFTAGWLSGSPADLRFDHVGPADDDFDTPGTIDAGATSPAFAGLSDGSTLAVFFAPAGMRYAVRPAGAATFGSAANVPATDLSGAAPPATAPDPRAGALVATTTDEPGLVALAYDAAPPELQTVTVPATATTGMAVALSAAARDDWSTPAVSWDFGDGTTAAGDAVGKTWTAPGTYQVTVTATDGVGQVEVETRQVVVSDPPAEPGPSSPPTQPAPPSPPAPPAGTAAPPAPPDRSAPRMTGLRLSRSVFAVSETPTALVAQRRRPALGTTISFRVNERSRILVSIEAWRRGFHSGGRCVSRRPRRSRGRARRCTRLVRERGTIRRIAAPGINGIQFSGRLGKRALRPGRYRFSIRAEDKAGNRSRPKLLAFQIVRG